MLYLNFYHPNVCLPVALHLTLTNVVFELSLEQNGQKHLVI